jgi:hypothetical protein
MPSRRRRPAPDPSAQPPKAGSGAGQGPSQTDALAKLKSLLDAGVLTREQYESELQRLIDK